MYRPTLRRLTPSGPTASRHTGTKVKFLARGLALELPLVPNLRQHDAEITSSKRHNNASR